MQQINNKIILSAYEVSYFMATFPCSGLRNRAYWFEFDDNGDLVDTDVPEQDDGPGASALADDCKNYLFGGIVADYFNI